MIRGDFMNVTTQCYLLTKSARINRVLDDMIDYAEKEHGVITMEELATILKGVQKHIASELTTRN